MLDSLYLRPQKYRRRKIRLQNSNPPFFDNGDEKPYTNFVPRNKRFLKSWPYRKAHTRQYSVRLALENTPVSPNLRGEQVTGGNRFLNLWPSTNLLLPNCELVLRRRYIGRNYLTKRRLLKNHF